MRKNLVNRRKQQGYTQEALADQVGCAKMHISNIENGKSGASFKMAIDLCNAINYQIDPTGKLQTAFDGVMMLPVTQVIQMAKSFNVPFDTENLFEVIQYVDAE